MDRDDVRKGGESMRIKRVCDVGRYYGNKLCNKMFHENLISVHKIKIQRDIIISSACVFGMDNDVPLHRKQVASKVSY